MSKTNKYRLFFTILLLVFDFLVLTGGLFFLLQLKTMGAEYIAEYSFSIFHCIEVFLDPAARNIWIWLQPAVMGALIWVWLTGRSTLHQFDSDMPSPAGHGQHGTARWMTEKEVDSFFTVHKF